MHTAWVRFRQGMSRDIRRVRRTFNSPSVQSRRLKHAIAWVLGALVVLWMVRGVLEDIEAPQAPLHENILYYALSTIAQSAAALAAILGAFGLWRLDRLRERDREDEDREHRTRQELLKVQYEQKTPAMAGDQVTVDEQAIFRATVEEPMLKLRLTSIQVRRQFFGAEWRWLIHALVTFLLGTLAILVLAIVGLAFIDTLRALVSTMRTGIILASLILGIGPAVLVWNTARRSRPSPILTAGTQDQDPHAIVQAGGNQGETSGMT